MRDRFSDSDILAIAPNPGRISSAPSALTETAPGSGVYRLKMPPGSDSELPQEQLASEPIPPRFENPPPAFDLQPSIIPAQAPPDPQDRPSHSRGSGGRKKAGWASFLLLLAAKAKTLLLGGKSLLILLKAGKILTTSGSMLVTVWLYSRFFGWPFAVGVVALIFVHEMGHVFVAWLQGMPVSAPIFIPFMGALIIQRRMPKSAWAEALMGIGGPLGGTIAALLCVGIYSGTGSQFFLGLAYFGFFLNLFNLTPVYPLDGGWIVAAISPYLWIGGLAILGILFALGILRNPFVFVLLLISLPTIWRGLKSKGEYFPGLEPATGSQKVFMGLGYVGLAGFLMFGMAACLAGSRLH